MDNNKKIIIGVVAAILLINFGLVPLINRQKGKAIVKRVFSFWVAKDNASGVAYFKDKTKFPPIYDLQSYTIETVKFEKVNGDLRGKFWLVLHFPQDNLLPDGKTWYCEIGKVSREWMILDLHILP